jgi:hypothetical protein
MSKDFVDCWILYRVRRRRLIPFFLPFKSFWALGCLYTVYVQQAGQSPGIRVYSRERANVQITLHHLGFDTFRVWATRSLSRLLLRYNQQDIRIIACTSG